MNKHVLIPKIIHYCWFGKGEMSPLACKCIDSWKQFFPDYKIVLWNEDNFDVNIIRYTSEAYKEKKYAFVSDYARFWILYKYGGLYFDTDVEVIRPMKDIIEKGPFMGFENNGATTTGVAPGLGMGATPGLELYKVILDYYSNEAFLNSDGTKNLTTVVKRVTDILTARGLKNDNKFQTIAGVNVFPYDYFCPIRITDGKLYLTTRTVSIHHYAASWTSPGHRFLRRIILAIGGAKLKKSLSDLRKHLK